MTTAPLILELHHATKGEITLHAGDITFDANESDSLIDPIREAAKKAQSDVVKVTGFRLGGDQVRHIVDATYSDDSGTWYEHRDGVYPADAALHGLMTMVLEEGVDDEFLERLDSAEGMKVNYCAPEPVTKEDYQAALKALILEVRASGHEGPALDEVVGLLGKDGIVVEDAPAPRM